jgi:hypothetical protein
LDIFNNAEVQALIPSNRILSYTLKKEIAEKVMEEIQKNQKMIKRQEIIFRYLEDLINPNE